MDIGINKAPRFLLNCLKFMMILHVCQTHHSISAHLFCRLMGKAKAYLRGVWAQGEIYPGQGAILLPITGDTQSYNHSHTMDYLDPSSYHPTTDVFGQERKATKHGRKKNTYSTHTGQQAGSKSPTPEMQGKHPNHYATVYIKFNITIYRINFIQAKLLTEKSYREV